MLRMSSVQTKGPETGNSVDYLEGPVRISAKCPSGWDSLSVKITQLKNEPRAKNVHEWPIYCPLRTVQGKTR